MAAVGYATLPIIPSLQGIGKKLNAEFEGPAIASANRAAKSIEQAMSDAAEQASFAVKKAREVEKNATQEVIDLEKKAAAAREQAARKTDAIAAAEASRDKAAAQGKASVIAAEQRLAKAREDGKSTVEDIMVLEEKLEAAQKGAAASAITANNRVSAAKDTAAKATAKATDLEDEWRNAQLRAADASGNLLAAQKRADTQASLTTKEFRAQQKEAAQLSGELRGMEKDVDGVGGAFDGAVGKVAGFAAGLAGIAGVAELGQMGLETSSSIDMMNMRLGRTGVEAEQTGASVREVLKSGVVASAEEAAATVGALESQFSDMGVEGKQSAADLADNFSAFSRVMNVDIAEATQTAGQLISHGLAPDVETAADLMTTAMQRVPDLMKDELPEIINEYGVNFANLGFSGEEAFSLLVSQAENGKIALDKTGDALKEFSLFAVDPAKAEVFESIGLSATDMATAVAEGGDKAREKLQETAQKLLEIEDPGVRAAKAIELFGTPLEDLGVEGIPAFLESMTGAEAGMAGFEGSSQQLADTIANSTQGRIDALKGAVTGLAEQGFNYAWEKGTQLSAWASSQSEWLTPVVVGVGTLTGVLGGVSLAIKTATAVSAAFNAVLALNPITLVVAAVAALTAGLIYFFTQTETGKAAWESFTGFLSDKWQWVQDKFNAGKTFINETVFGGIQTKVEQVKNTFSNVVDGIGTVWDSLKGKLARPINFMIGTVYGRGIKGAFDSIAKILPGIGSAPNIANIPEHATGGPIVGPGHGTSDDVLMWGSHGEHMWTDRERRLAGGHDNLYAMRGAVRRDRPFIYDGQGGVAVLPKTDNRAGDLAGAAPGLMIPGFKDGGEIRPMWEMQLENGHRAAKMRHGNPYTWGHEDCSGYMSMIADAIINGGNGVRRWATGSFPGGQPWVPGLGRGFSVGVHDNPGGPGGGHTAGTLSAVGSYGSVNVESGGGHGYVAYGGPAAGADSPQFAGKHPGLFHLAIGADGAFESAGGPSMEAMLAKVREKLESTIDTVMNPIKELLPSPPPAWMGIPPAAYEKGKTELLDTAFDLAAKLGDKLRTAYEAVKDITSLVSSTVGRGTDWIADRAGRAIGLHDQGGWLMPGQLATNQLRKPEPVLTPEQWADISRMVATLPTIGQPLKRLVDLLEVESKISWDERMVSLTNHLEGIEVNDKGEAEKTRGRIGTPGEIAQWAGTEIAESVGNEALGLIGLDGLLSLPRTLDDDLRVPYTKNQDTAPGEVGTLVEPKSVASVAEQATAEPAQSVTLNVTFNNVDPENVDELQRMVDELATKVSDATTSRRTAAAVSRGRSI